MFCVILFLNFSVDSKTKASFYEQSANPLLDLSLRSQSLLAEGENCVGTSFHFYRIESKTGTHCYDNCESVSNEWIDCWGYSPFHSCTRVYGCSGSCISCFTM